MTNEPLKPCPAGDCDLDEITIEHKDGLCRVICPCGVSGPWVCDVNPRLMIEAAEAEWNDLPRRTLPGRPGREALLAAEAVISPHCGEWGKKDCGAPDCALQQVAAWLRKIGEGK